ncbi:hypothetical protein HK101_010410 [Irineochytrium annulatum]|nr:hypothetical protein HK101_010410 [Irineochytrium annulatum]
MGTRLEQVKGNLTTREMERGNNIPVPQRTVRLSEEAAQGGLTLLPPDQPELAQSAEPAEEWSDSRIESLVKDILQRQDRWENAREELDVNLRRMRDAVSTGNSTVISNELEGGTRASSETEMPRDGLTDEMRQKIMAGFATIQKLDAVIKEKNAIVQSLQSSRQPTAMSHERTATATTADTGDDSASEFGSEVELRSVGSAVKERTFITEPAWNRNKVHLPRKASDGHSTLARRVMGVAETAESMKSRQTGGAYQRGNFIQRNIALGPDARYFDAMTEDERRRVENLLRDDDNLDSTNEPDDFTTLLPPGTLPMLVPAAAGSEYGDTSENGGSAPPASSGRSTLGTRFGSISAGTSILAGCDEELGRLADIDRKLAGLGSRGLWGGMANAWTPNGSGISTPALAAEEASEDGMDERDVETIMGQRIEFSGPVLVTDADEKARLKQIEMELQKIQKAKEAGAVQVADREAIERLLCEIMEYEY